MHGCMARKKGGQSNEKKNRNKFVNIYMHGMNSIVCSHGSLYFIYQSTSSTHNIRVLSRQTLLKGFYFLFFAKKAGHHCCFPLLAFPQSRFDSRRRGRGASSSALSPAILLYDILFSTSLAFFSQKPPAPGVVSPGS